MKRRVRIDLPLLWKGGGVVLTKKEMLTYLLD
ncbi:hypothetical protein MGA3_13871 [Bacillus methanolicus MGA3]|nr:hypothetical protein MGA3_13871 [Bacillus methanolicus MGA3]